MIELNQLIPSSLPLARSYGRGGGGVRAARPKTPRSLVASMNFVNRFPLPNACKVVFAAQLCPAILLGFRVRTLTPNPSPIRMGEGGREA